MAFKAEETIPPPQTEFEKELERQRAAAASGSGSSQTGSSSRDSKTVTIFQLPNYGGYGGWAPSSKTYLTDPDYSQDDQALALWDKPGYLTDDERNYVKMAALSYYGKTAEQVDPSWYSSFWLRAFTSAASSGADVFSIMGNLAKDGQDGSGTSGSGSVSGGASTVSTYDFTQPEIARKLVDTSLKGYLGRSATEEEVKQFTTALRAEEQGNPTVVTQTGSTNTRSGGVNAELFAEDYALQQEGAAEYQAATKYLDLFMGALG